MNRCASIITLADRRCRGWLPGLVLGLLALPCQAGLLESLEPTAPDLIDRRLAEPDSLFSLRAYKPNYVLPVTWSDAPNPAYEVLEPVELKFQLSLMVSLWQDPFGTPGEIFFGYTQQSWWQAYNGAISSPFRETNYEPELFWLFDADGQLGKLQLRKIRIGLVHQSNGRALPLSRSWNRVYVNFLMRYDRLYISLRPWLRLPEPAKTAPDDPAGDDNPDILNYMGPGDLVLFTRRGKHDLSLLLRNNFDRPNHGAIQFDWAYPLNRRVKWHIQYFNGYGESLIDYDHKAQKIGIGLMLSNWL